MEGPGRRFLIQIACCKARASLVVFVLIMFMPLKTCSTSAFECGIMRGQMANPAISLNEFEPDAS